LAQGEAPLHGADNSAPRPRETVNGVNVGEASTASRSVRRTNFHAVDRFTLVNPSHAQLLALPFNAVLFLTLTAVPPSRALPQLKDQQHRDPGRSYLAANLSFMKTSRETGTHPGCATRWCAT
jgi:hypothetical protein